MTILLNKMTGSMWPWFVLFVVISMLSGTVNGAPSQSKGYEDDPGVYRLNLLPLWSQLKQKEATQLQRLQNLENSQTPEAIAAQQAPNQYFYPLSVQDANHDRDFRHRGDFKNYKEGERAKPRNRGKKIKSQGPPWYQKGVFKKMKDFFG